MEAREWNTHDFEGKFHYSRFKEKSNPIPGTQIKIEREYANDKEERDKRWEREAFERRQAVEAKLRAKTDGAQFRTKVYFDAVIGRPMEKIEAVFHEKATLLDAKNVPLDDPRSIEKFVMNVELGRHHYVSFAMNKGYKSINYQDPRTGDSPLHIAVRKGHVDTVEELLKYGADNGAKNNLGNHPMHDAWFFWKTHHNRTREERLDQEDRTCQILLKIFSYGGFVDSLDLDKQTPLHLACRYGPTHAVKIALSFKADYFLATKSGKLPTQIALEHGQQESYRLLLSWEKIRHHLVHLDFHVVWNRFLKDYEAVINDNKSAEAILLQLDMEKNIHVLERAHHSGVPIDDPLLYAAYSANKLNKEIVPKPWEPGWAEFVKMCKQDGVVDLITRIEQGGKKAKGTGKKKESSYFKKEKKRYFPDKPTPEPKPRMEIVFPPPSSSSAKESKLPLIKECGEDEAAKDEEVEKEEGVETEEEEEETASVGTLKTISGSHLSQRRKKLAHAVAMDGKFLKFTKKLATASALSISQRLPQAPLQGTAEEHSLIRHLVSQGPEFVKFEKNKKIDRFAELVGLKKEPKLSVLGAYCEPADFMQLNDRDKLYGQLHNMKSPTQQDVPSEVLGTGRKMEVIEVERRPKIDLVSDARPRYVDKDLLPSVRHVSQIELMSRAIQEQKEATRMKKQGLGTHVGMDAARAEMEAAILQNVQSLEHDLDPEKAAHAQDGYLSLRQRKANDERALTMHRMFLQKEEVKYGKGRVTSTHNSKGKLEEPWTTVGGRYSTLPGDRTA